MATLEEQFHTWLTGFLDDKGMAPTTFGMRAVGDPNLMPQIERGRSLTLRTADRVVAFMDRYEVVAGSAEAVRLSGRSTARAFPVTRSCKSSGNLHDY